MVVALAVPAAAAAPAASVPAAAAEEPGPAQAPGPRCSATGSRVAPCMCEGHVVAGDEPAHVARLDADAALAHGRDRADAAEHEVRRDGVELVRVEVVALADDDELVELHAADHVEAPPVVVAKGGRREPLVPQLRERLQVLPRHPRALALARVAPEPPHVRHVL